ncbi:HDOD domain-containing protein [Methylocaldum sp.]|uniref:HDOD domain-containing protein n=1 Tax=Methylocaldum sp. TaxID=1969727 RepID=UPI002D42ABEC|nr:HDOD domain-containing protein [Methylocaldum sp.]HYE37055.1 HDOD domain-containing protein [Methylocaldum sp.]
MLVTETPETLVIGAPQLASPPAAVARISTILGRENFTAGEVAEAIGQDPALTARLLKIVNSPYYGFSGRIDTISRAVGLVGVDMLYSLALTTSVIQGFRKIPTCLVNMTDFWLNSLYCGEIARLLAKEASVLHSERLFVAGLLHRIGALIIYIRLPDEAREILLAAAGDDRLIPGLEKDLLGFTYAEIGAELAKAWKVPPALRESIRWHLDPEQAEDYRLEASLLYLANQLKTVSLLGFPVEEVLAAIPDEVTAATRLEESQILSVMSDVAEKFSDTAALFIPDAHVRH